MTEFIAALLANPVFRSAVEGIAVKIVADILHRRNTNPNFLASSDVAFAALSTAKTEEDRENALKNLQALVSS